MQPAVLQAISVWELSWNETQAAAVAALKTAFPPLTDRPRYVGCDGIRLEYQEPGLGEGLVRLDDEGRANVELDQVPNEVIARAVDEIQFPYLDHADGPLRDAPPGTYIYDCEPTNTQFEFVLGALGHGRVIVSFATVPDAATLLATMTEVAQAGT